MNAIRILPPLDSLRVRVDGSYNASGLYLHSRPRYVFIIVRDTHITYSVACFFEPSLYSIQVVTC